jgi:hypothetical protein
VLMFMALSQAEEGNGRGSDGESLKLNVQQ